MSAPYVRRAAWVAAALLVGLAAWLGARQAALGVVTRRVHAAAAERGLEARWQRVALGFPDRVEFRGLVLAGPRDTVFRAESLAVRVDPWSSLLRRPRLRAVALARSRVRLTRGAAEADTLEVEAPRDRDAVRSERVRRAAEQAARLLLAPAREAPSIVLRDVVVESPGGGEEPASGVRIAALDLAAGRRGIRLAARGSLSLERPVPFEARVDYGRDDRLAGRARILVPGSDGRPAEPLDLALEGRVAQDRAAGETRLEPGSRLVIGRLPLALSGSVALRGPRVRLSLAADRVTQALVVQSLPRAVLGPLVDVAVEGAFDYRLRFDLDVAHPDRVDFTADVISRGLRLDPARTRLNLLGLSGPFVATIRLPRGVVARRELSPVNPHFRTLAEIDPRLVAAVVTNEDGSFFRHRGFNTDAVREAIAENLEAGAFRRGAGTITMQLARNLYLGHERTLSRKGQEVVLAWVLEHLTGVGKERLLEIYLNIIEWGPGVHGADEAAHYYFGHGAGQVTVDEALFLSTVIPAPKRWRARFGPDARLRRWAAAQMHFIGRAMIAKGWLDPGALPPRESLGVELAGPAGERFAPPPGPAPADSARRGFRDWFFEGKRSI